MAPSLAIQESWGISQRAMTAVPDKIVELQWGSSEPVWEPLQAFTIDVMDYPVSEPTPPFGRSVDSVRRCRYLGQARGGTAKART